MSQGMGPEWGDYVMKHLRVTEDLYIRSFTLVILLNPHSTSESGTIASTERNGGLKACPIATYPIERKRDSIPHFLTPGSQMEVCSFWDERLWPDADGLTAKIGVFCLFK